MIKGYNPEGELYFYKGNEDEAHKVAELLMHNNYVVMLSKEEGGTILSYLNTCESHESDRNLVAFMPYWDFEDLLFNRPYEDNSTDSMQNGIDIMRRYDDCASNKVDEDFGECEE